MRRGAGSACGHAGGQVRGRGAGRRVEGGGGAGGGGGGGGRSGGGVPDTGSGVSSGM